MILVAVGTQFPFDRLVETVDRWAGSSNRNDVVAQVGPSSLAPAHLRAHAFLPPAQFQKLIEQAELIIAHCGMGSILSALSLGKPIVVVPRSAARGEHRNDHQFATARRFASQPGVTVVWDAAELLRFLDRYPITNGRTAGFEPIEAKAPRELTERLRQFLQSGIIPA